MKTVSVLLLAILWCGCGGYSSPKPPAPSIFASSLLLSAFPAFPDQAASYADPNEYPEALFPVRVEELPWRATRWPQPV